MTNTSKNVNNVTINGKVVAVQQDAKKITATIECYFSGNKFNFVALGFPGDKNSKRLESLEGYIENGLVPGGEVLITGRLSTTKYVDLEGDTHTGYACVIIHDMVSYEKTDTIKDLVIKYQKNGAGATEMPLQFQKGFYSIQRYPDMGILTKTDIRTNETIQYAHDKLNEIIEEIDNEIAEFKKNNGKK